MKHLSSAVLAVALASAGWTGAHAQGQSEITLLAVGPMRVPTQKIVTAFEAKSGRTVKITYGNGVDLHAGGADLRYPHHAFETAQAEAATGVTPFARAWMHVGTVRIGGVKMA